MTPDAFMQAYEQATRAHDLDALMALVADDAVYLFSNASSHVGAAAIRSQAGVRAAVGAARMTHDRGRLNGSGCHSASRRDRCHYGTSATNGDSCADGVTSVAPRVGVRCDKARSRQWRPPRRR